MAMKRFATIAAAAVAGLLWPSPAFAAEPNVALGQPLSFGSVVHSGAGTVAVGTDGTAAYTGGVEAFRQGAAPREARVAITGEPGQALTITLAGGGSTAALGSWSIDQLVLAVDSVQSPVPERSAAGGVPISLSSIPGTPAEVRIGGRLTLPAGLLEPGATSGSILIEATYE